MDLFIFALSIQPVLVPWCRHSAYSITLSLPLVFEIASYPFVAGPPASGASSIITHQSFLHFLPAGHETPLPRSVIHTASRSNFDQTFCYHGLACLPHGAVDEHPVAAFRDNRGHGGLLELSTYSCSEISFSTTNDGLLVVNKPVLQHGPLIHVTDILH